MSHYRRTVVHTYDRFSVDKVEYDASEKNETQDPSSLELAERFVVGHPGAVAVLACWPNDEVTLLRQFRPALNAWLWEIPAGTKEPGESDLQSAQRELAEEAGLVAKTWTPLRTIYPSPGMMDEKLTLFLAEDLSQQGAHPEQYERIEVHRLALVEVLLWAQSGKITDAKTLLALGDVQRRRSNASASDGAD